MTRGSKGIGKAVSAVAAVLSLAAMGAGPALAGRHDERERREVPRYEERGRDYRDNDREGGGVRVGIDLNRGWERRPEVVIPPQRVWVEPVYRTVCEKQWVPATYRTVTERVWRDAVSSTVVERVWVNECWEWRDVEHVDRYGRRYCTREQVFVPGHYQDRPRTVVTPGHYEDVCRQELVCEGHWQDVQRQELVSAGHWEECGPARVYRPAGPLARIDLRIPF